MPLYSYVCKKCGTEFDLLIGVTGKDEAKSCKKCGSKKIEKSFAPFGVNVSSGKPSCSTGTCPF